MRFYLIRHGQTEWNIEGKIQGKTDIPLNETGLHQAALLAEGMRGRSIAAVYSSPLLRAAQTAELLAEEKGLKVRLVPELREVDFGLWEGRSWEEVDAAFHEDLKKWEENPALYMPTGGESRESCRLRCKKAVERMLEELERDREAVNGASGAGIRTGDAAGSCDAAIVAHGGILAHVVSYLLRNHRGKEEIIVKNASISIVEYDRETESGTLRLLNGTAHLGASPGGKTNKFC